MSLVIESSAVKSLLLGKINLKYDRDSADWVFRPTRCKNDQYIRQILAPNA